MGCWGEAKWKGAAEVVAVEGRQWLWEEMGCWLQGRLRVEGLPPKRVAEVAGVAVPRCGGCKCQEECKEAACS